MRSEDDFADTCTGRDHPPRGPMQVGPFDSEPDPKYLEHLPQGVCIIDMSRTAEWREMQRQKVIYVDERYAVARMVLPVVAADKRLHPGERMLFAFYSRHDASYVVVQALPHEAFVRLSPPDFIRKARMAIPYYGGAGGGTIYTLGRTFPRVLLNDGGCAVRFAREVHGNLEIPKVHANGVCGTS